MSKFEIKQSSITSPLSLINSGQEHATLTENTENRTLIKK